MSQLEGVTSNHALLTIINDLHGKDVLVETTDGNQYVGLFAACSPTSTPELEIGLKYAYRKSEDNAKNLLARKSEIIDKIIFKFGDIVSVSAHLSEEKLVKGFATDRDYHGSKGAANGRSTDEELQMWECDDEGSEIETTSSSQMPDARQKYQSNGGWSAAEMFDANHKVISTFDDSLSQYTTVEVNATDEMRRLADKLAREIEGNASSRHYSQLENDDTERDLDKETVEDDFDMQGKRGQRGGNTFNNSRNGRGGAGTTGTNRRAEAMKGGNDRRGSSGQPARYGPGGPGQHYGQQRGGQAQQQYIPGQTRRPTGAEVQEQFQEFAAKESGSAKKDGGPKVYENSNFKGQSKVLLEPARPSPSPRTVTDKSGSQARRTENLREWNEGFNYRGSKDSASSSEKEATPSESPARTVPPTGNAWNKGPPTSLVSVGSHNSNVSPNPASPSNVPPPAEPTPGTSAEPENLNMSDNKPDLDRADSPVKDSGNETMSTVDTSAPGLECKDDLSNKKFSFNPNAPAFTPRLAPTTPTPQMMGQPSMQPLPAVQMAPSGVHVPGMPPPGVPTVTAQPVVWHGSAQGYPQMAAQYPYMVNGQQMVGVSAPMSMAPPRGPSAGPQIYAQQQTQRRPTGPPTAAVMVASSGQWPNQMVMQQGMVPYAAYPQYQMQGGAGGPPQQYAGPPQIMQPVQQQMVQQQYPQRFPTMGTFVMPPQQPTPQQPSGPPSGQQRYPTPQQTPHQGHENASYQQGSVPVASVGQSSQPPTPGPQPVASPAQPQAPGRGSPATISAPPAQQFMHVPSAQQQQQQMMQHHQFYGQHPNMYIYSPQPNMMMYSAPPGMAMGHAPSSHPDQQPHHMDGTMIQTAPVPHQQFVAHDQFGNYVPAGGPGGYYAGPQGHPQQPMSRQNSVPQNYAGQGAPPGMQQIPTNGPPQQQQPPQQQHQSTVSSQQQ